MSSSINQKKNHEIVVDQAKGLVFSSEEELYAYFISEIKTLESEFFKLRSTSNDIHKAKFSRFDKHLNDALEDPGEIWEDNGSLKGRRLAIYIKDFSKNNDESLFHVAITYLIDDIPSFVYLHFPTKDMSLIEKYRRGHLLYKKSLKEIPVGAAEGDALMEGNNLALGLYKAMSKLRSDKDIQEENFSQYIKFRETTIEDADEIWRGNDSMGNILVRFIKEFSFQGEDIFYVVVTVEEMASNSHALLFSFPTRDKGLVMRYRYGENLQAEEVVRESSH